MQFSLQEGAPPVRLDGQHILGGVHSVPAHSTPPTGGGGGGNEEHGTLVQT